MVKTENTKLRWCTKIAAEHEMETTLISLNNFVRFYFLVVTPSCVVPSLSTKLQHPFACTCEHDSYIPDHTVLLIKKGGNVARKCAHECNVELRLQLNRECMNITLNLLS
jgi:hypothetical protein